MALFHSSLAALCRGGMALGRALRLAAADLGRAPLARHAAALADAVDAGVPLATAYADASRPFPPLYAALVAAGVATGDLPSALTEIATHAKIESDATLRIRRALIHPVVTATCALVVGLGAAAFATPRLWTLSEEAGHGSPTPIALGALGVLAVLLAAVVFLAFRRSPMSSQRRGTRGLALPGVGPLRAAASEAGFATTLALLLRRETPLHDALTIAARSCADAGLASRVEKAADRVRAGEPLAASLAAEGAFDPSVLWLVESAHGSSGVAQALDDVGSLLRRRFERGLDRFTAWLRPCAEVVVGLVVLAFAYSYMVPLVRQANDVMKLWGS
jgi:general secretion pathway protein F